MRQCTPKNNNRLAEPLKLDTHTHLPLPHATAGSFSFYRDLFFTEVFSYLQWPVVFVEELLSAELDGSREEVDPNALHVQCLPDFYELAVGPHGHRRLHSVGHFGHVQQTSAPSENL